MLEKRGPSIQQESPGMQKGPLIAGAGTLAGSQQG